MRKATAQCCGSFTYKVRMDQFAHYSILYSRKVWQALDQLNCSREKQQLGTLCNGGGVYQCS